MSAEQAPRRDAPPERRSLRAPIAVVAVEIVVIAALALGGILWGYAGVDCGEVCITATPFLILLVICAIVAGLGLWWARSKARQPSRAAAFVGVGLAATTIVISALLYRSLDDSGWLPRVSNAVEDLFASVVR